MQISKKGIEFDASMLLYIRAFSALSTKRMVVVPTSSAIKAKHLPKSPLHIIADWAKYPTQ
jgi:hypothetical protein